jgi:hypothetical protein
MWIAARRGNKTSALSPDRVYGCFRYGGRAQLAHRVAYLLTKGDVGEGLEVLHSCDNPSCVNPAHLLLGTHLDNMRDCWTKGRGKMPRGMNKGSRHGHAKLNEKMVLQMRAMAATGKYTYEDLAKRFGISRTNASIIIRRIGWKHV